jgi:hypothetical protein
LTGPEPSRTIRFQPIVNVAMRIHVFGPLIVSTVLGAIAAPAAGQTTLADVARKEEARRKAAPGGGKSYSNDDLVPVPPSGPGPADGSAPVPATAAGAADAAKGAANDAAKDAVPGAGKTDNAKSAAGGEKRDQAYWAKRMADLREQVERDTSYAEAMQTRVNALTTDFTNRDDPAQRARIGVDRQKALNDLDRLKKAIVDGKRAITDLEDEARRAGVPAGWLR